jgi:uncharacterized protein (TIGR02646 family)
MRSISKGKEPASLAEHRSAAFANYANYADMASLRNAIVTEQRGLCCYCLGRIRPTSSEMKIEHWHSQESDGAEQLDYSNLLGACMGNTGQPWKDQHCDTRKGDRDLSRNPSNPDHQIEDFIRFLPDGRINSPDRRFDEELNSVLNLNLAFLVNNRKALLDGFLKVISRPGAFPRTKLEKWVREWNGESHVGDLEPYCQVVVYWLRKRLRRC